MDRIDRSFYMPDDDTITVGCYRSDDLNVDHYVVGEFDIIWVDTVGDGYETPKLEVFEDAWETLYMCQDVIAALATVSGQAPDPDEVIELLKSCGLEDCCLR